MTGQDLPYFKFVQPLIDAGIWAKMSSAARTLYPVLLRFSDRNFAPVYPGSNLLLDLTGFKQKSSLRKAREELVRIGLIRVTPGNGRINSVYHFRFDWAEMHPRGAQRAPSGVHEKPPLGVPHDSSGGAGVTPAYNQIQISINNNQNPSKKNDRGDGGTWEALEAKYGKENVRLTRSELSLAGLPDNSTDVEKLLSGRPGFAGLSWEEIRLFLSERVSAGSLELLDKALLRDEKDVLVFRNSLPLHLKHLLGRVAPNACFEADPALSGRGIWNQAGNDG